ncbi:MAG: CBS domain-containing protein [Pseudomonadales bacterium]|nr:CBS domain-containing protein [Pseudomonadales bacterium]
MSKSVEVRDYMRKPVTVEQSMTVSEAAQIILKHKLSGLVVVDSDNNLVGMLSELDCLKAIVSAVYNGDEPGAEIVQHIMTKNVEVNQPDEDIITVAASMLDHKHRRRPIVDNGKLVGQVTCRQLLRAIKGFGSR